MISAFGVEHGYDDIEKFDLPGAGKAFGAGLRRVGTSLSTGFKGVAKPSPSPIGSMANKVGIGANKTLGHIKTGLGTTKGKVIAGTGIGVGGAGVGYGIHRNR